VRHRSGVKFGITLATTVVMILLYMLLIPAYGSMGAALATLGGFAFLAACTWVVTQRIFPVRYEGRRLALLLALGVALWLLSWALPMTLWALPVKGALWLSAPVLLWCTGFMSTEEKDHVRDLLRRWLPSPRRGERARGTS
jgi:O-antigen/teichoic acid export membrane protein